MTTQTTTQTPTADQVIGAHRAMDAARDSNAPDTYAKAARYFDLAWRYFRAHNELL